MSDMFVDDIARAMTDVDAPAHLRTRVLVEIGRPHSRQWSAAALPLAAATLVMAVGVLALRPLVTEFEVPAVPRPALVQLAANDPAPRTITAGVTAAPARPSEPAISADELAWLSRRLPALETRALALEPIQPAMPSIAPISVDPIALEPIAIPPPGSGSGDRR